MVTGVIVHQDKNRGSVYRKLYKVKQESENCPRRFVNYAIWMK